MIRTFSALSLLSLLAMVGASCASSSTSSSPAPQPAPETKEVPQKLVGRFLFSVDPQAAVPLTITQLAIDERSSANGLGAAAQGATVTSSATLTGPGTWTAATHTLSATVYIQNTGDSTNNWDEPSLKISSVTSTATVNFQQVNSGTFTSVGSGANAGGVGSSYSFADINKAGSTGGVGGSATDYALQKIAILDSSDKAFNFTVDVLASQVTTVVAADKDHDGWNTETGAAGGDCDDFDATKYPGGGTCTCGTSSGSCSSCTAGGCCTLAGAENCANSCTCTETQSTNTSTSVTCGTNSVCSFSATNKADSTISTCNSGANCSMTCDGPSTKCTVGVCDAATCSITTSNGTGGNNADGTISVCKNGSTCVINCSSNSKCSLTCSDATSSCRINNTSLSGQTISLTCFGSTAPTTCADGSGGTYTVCGSC